MLELLALISLLVLKGKASLLLPHSISNVKAKFIRTTPLLLSIISLTTGVATILRHTELSSSHLNTNRRFK